MANSRSSNFEAKHDLVGGFRLDKSFCSNEEKTSVEVNDDGQVVFRIGGAATIASTFILFSGLALALY